MHRQSARRTHQVSRAAQRKAGQHGGARGVAAGEGVAVHGDHQHVRQVVRRPRAAHERLERGYGGQVKHHSCEQRRGGAALRRVCTQRQHDQRASEPQPALAEALEKLERTAFSAPDAAPCVSPLRAAKASRGEGVPASQASCGTNLCEERLGNRGVELPSAGQRGRGRRCTATRDWHLGRGPTRPCKAAKHHGAVGYTEPARRRERRGLSSLGLRRRLMRKPARVPDQ